jgi:hypothetical protein
MTNSRSDIDGVESHVGRHELSVSLMDAREYRGVTYWCSPDGLCELPMDCGTACGSEDLLKDMIDVDAEGLQ